MSGFVDGMDKGDGALKTCCTCREEKELSEFSKDRKRKDGLHPACKDCGKKYYLLNKQKIIDRNRDWNAKNPTKVQAQRERAKNKEGHRDRAKDYKNKFLNKNPSYVKEYAEKYKKTETYRLFLEKRREANEFKNLGGEAYE